MPHLLSSLALLLTVSVGLPRVAQAKPKLPEAVAPLPDVEEMLTQAGWTMTPELAALYSRPGDILSESNVLQITGPDCFDAQVEEGAFATMEVTQSMSAGVRAKVKVVGVRGGVALEKKIVFDAPVTRRIAELSLVPSGQCAAKLRAAEARGKDLSGWYVITESLSAVIQQLQCGSYNAEAGTFLVSADASVQQACAQTSLEPVAVAFKIMSVPDLLAMLPEPGPKAEVHLGGEVQGYGQPAQDVRGGESNSQVRDVEDALNVQSILLAPNGDGPNPTGEATVTMGEEQDYAELARQVAASQAAETHKQEELLQNAADAAAYLAEVEKRKQQFEDALALERERLAKATKAAETALEAERNRRIEEAAAPIREKANRDFSQISPHMRQDMPPAARSLLLAFLRQYQSAAVEIDGEQFPVELAAVRTARAYLGERISLTEPNSIGLVFAELPPGVFTMGCTEGRGVTCEDGETAHSVQIRQMFAVATTEVTQEQWTAVTGDGPSASNSCGPTCPVENVSWQDATEFANRLSKLEGLDECYVFEQGTVGWPSGLDCTGYRLLTEAEWEYAARASENHAYAGSDEAEEVAWVSSNSDGQPQPVATRKANAWRIHDMSGNVWEWVWDGHAPFSTAPTVDPLGPGGNGDKVNRGGSWYLSADQACVSRRFSYYAGYRAHDVGLRIGRTVK